MISWIDGSLGFILFLMNTLPAHAITTESFRVSITTQLRNDGWVAIIKAIHMSVAQEYTKASFYFPLGSLSAI